MDFLSERFGLIAPAAAALSALSIPIILMYMLRLRRVEMQISSNFLWQQLVRDREANAPWQRLRFSWLLLLQLLILLALVIALTRPFAKVESIASDNVVLLLDASASMNATDVDGSRFDRAKEMALEVVETSGTGVVGRESRVTVIRVAAMPEILAAAETNDFAVQQALDEAQASESGADWETAFALAAGSFGGSETSEVDVIIITDGGSLENIPDIAPDDQRVLVVGDSAENVGISQLSIRSRAGESPQLFAQVHNYGMQDAEVILSLNLDGALFSAQRYLVPAGESVNVLQDELPARFNEIVAEISQPSSSTVPDYLPTDDRAYAVYNPAGTRRILLMTERNIFLQQVFSSLPEVELTMAEPINGMPRDTFDLYVFDGWLPDRLPDGDILIINPPDDTLLFRVGEQIMDVNQTQVTNILEDDERTRYLDFNNVNIRQFRQISEYEDWATTLVQARGGPLLIAGEVDQRQIAVLTFALQDSDLPLQLAFPILMANLTQWYTPPRLLSLNDSIVPGTPVTVRTVEGDSVQITLPDGEISVIELDEAAQIVFAGTQQAGIYQVEVREGDRVVGTDAFAVNLFSPQESNIAPQETFSIGQNAGGTDQALTGEEVGQRELWQYLALAGLILLLVEWLYYHRANLRQAAAVPSLYRRTPRQRRG